MIEDEVDSIDLEAVLLDKALLICRYIAVLNRVLAGLEGLDYDLIHACSDTGHVILGRIACVCFQVLNELCLTHG